MTGEGEDADARAGEGGTLPGVGGRVALLSWMGWKLFSYYRLKVCEKRIVTFQGTTLPIGDIVDSTCNETDIEQHLDQVVNPAVTE